jgi:hypothetical protein
MEESPSSETKSLSTSQEIPHLHGTQRFFTVFKRFGHWSSSWARWIQFTTSHPTHVRFILILSSHLRLVLPRGPFPSGFPTKTCWKLSLRKHSLCSLFTYWSCINDLPIDWRRRWNIETTRIANFDGKPIWKTVIWKTTNKREMQHRLTWLMWWVNFLSFCSRMLSWYLEIDHNHDGKYILQLKQRC